MTPANVKALIAGGVVVVGGTIGAFFWNAHRAETPRAAAKPPAVALESTRSPQEAKPKDAPEVADLGTPSNPQSSNPQSSKPQPKPEPPAGHGEPPHFDVVRVEPSGDAVLAGKGDPNAKVALLDSGKVVAEAKTDASGNFVILPPTLKPGSYDLSLRQSETGKAATDSKQNIAVSVPAKPSGQVVVALAEPGKPTKLLSAPPKAPDAVAKPPEAAPDTPAATSTPASDLAIRSAEIENGTGFYATGTAKPGTRIEVYLNGSHLAHVVAGPDGQWSVTVKRGLKGGRYAVRADAIAPDGKVVARVEVPFDVPVEVAEAAKPAPAAQAAEPPKTPEPPQTVAAAAPKPAPTPALKPAPTPALKAAEAPKPPEKAPEPSKTVVNATKPAPSPPSKTAEAPKLREKTPAPRVVAAAEAPPQAVQPPVVPIAPSTPAAPQSKVAAPQPEVAAAAKAAAGAAPSTAPPTLAVAPPTPPAERNVIPPQQMAVAAAKPAAAPPMLAGTKPSIASPPEPTASATPQTGSSSNVVIDTVETALVVSGDNLWNISRVRLGDGFRYTRIYAANVSQIRNPALIYPGQVFVVPSN